MKVIFSIAIIASLFLFSCANSPSMAIYDQFSFIKGDKELGFAESDKEEKNLTKIPQGIYKIKPKKEGADVFSKDLILLGSANFRPIDDVDRFFATGFLVEDRVKVYESASTSSTVVANLAYPKILAVKFNYFPRAEGQFTEVLDQNGLHGFIESKAIENIPIHAAIEPAFPTIINLDGKREMTDIMGKKHIFEKGTPIVVLAKTQVSDQKANYTVLGLNGIVCRLDALDFFEAEALGAHIKGNHAAFEIKPVTGAPMLLSKRETIDGAVVVRRLEGQIEGLKLAFFVEDLGKHETSLKLVDLETGAFVSKLPVDVPETFFEFKNTRTFGYVAMPVEAEESTSLVILDFKNGQWKVYQKESAILSREFFSDPVQITEVGDDSSFLIKAKNKEIKIKFKDGIISL